MKRTIMKGLAAFCTGVMMLGASSSLFVSCDKYDDTLLKQEIESLKGELGDLSGDVTDLDTRLKAVEALKTQLTELTSKVDALYTLKFQVSDANELQYSFDGGKTWKGTEIILASQTAMKFRVSDKNELQYSEDNGKTWKDSGIVLAKNCEKALDFKVENGKVLYTLDGTTWEETGATVVDPCACPEVDLVDNGTSVTIKVGNKEFTIEKPLEIAFEIKAGKLQFASEATQQIALKTIGIEDLTILATPKGWTATINADGFLEVTAPKAEATEDVWNDDYTEMTPATAVEEGEIKIYAVGTDGRTMVGKLAVELSEYPVAVTVSGGKYTISAPQASMWSPVYFGVSTKETLEEDFLKVADLVIAAEMMGDDPEWDYLVTDGDTPLTGDIAETFGKELVAGGEYIIWVANWHTITGKLLENATLAYYTHVNVAITEDESKRTAYEVFVSVDAKGADSYFVSAIPENVGYDAATVKAMMIQELTGEGGGGVAPLTKAPSSSFAKLYTEPYNGPLSRIGTESVMLVPGQKCILLVLPFDGRPYNQYTVADFVEKEFVMNSLTEGGSANAEAKKITSYTTETGREVIVDPYKQLCVEFTPTVDTYKYAYFTFIHADEYEEYATDAEIVDALLNMEGVTPYGKEEQFNGICTWYGLKPEDAMVFVGFFVDENDKYGKPVVLELATEAIEYNTTMSFTVETNVVENTLTGTELNVTVQLADGATASTYKYYWFDATYSYSDYFKNSTAEEIVEKAVLGEYNYYLKESSTATFTVSNNRAGKKYFIAVIPYDENGLPVSAAWSTYYTAQAAQ